MLDTIIQFLTNTQFYAYLIVFIIGLGWVALGLILGGLQDMMEFAHDMGSEIVSGGDAEPWGHQQVGLSPFSPLLLAVFGMIFGMMGMTLTQFTDFSLLPVAGIALVTSLGVDGLLYTVLYQFFVKAQSSSLPNVHEAVGMYATVATRVAPGMTGSINYEIAGRRAIASARSHDAQAHEAGEIVRIASMQGGIALIEKK